jgi:hypothetical protein
MAVQTWIHPALTRPANENAGHAARVQHSGRAWTDQKLGRRGAPMRPPPGPPGVGFGFIGSSPSRCMRLRASLRARRIASAFSRAFFSEGFS